VDGEPRARAEMLGEDTMSVVVVAALGMSTDGGVRYVGKVVV
jgi:hypothetical protein